MAKKNRQFSQLPYATRLMIRKECEIQAQREQCAMRMVMSIMEALHSNEGIGLNRLTKFGRLFISQIGEFYEDWEIEEVHLRQRLLDHGIEFNDFMDAIDWEGKSKKAQILAEGKDAAMVALLVAMVTCNDLFGMGNDRLHRLIETTEKIVKDCAVSAERVKVHEDALRNIGFCIENGKVLIWQADDGKVIHQKKMEEKYDMEKPSGRNAFA